MWAYMTFTFILRSILQFLFCIFFFFDFLYISFIIFFFRSDDVTMFGVSLQYLQRAAMSNKLKELTLITERALWVHCQITGETETPSGLFLPLLQSAWAAQTSVCITYTDYTFLTQIEINFLKINITLTYFGIQIRAMNILVSHYRH